MIQRLQTIYLTLIFLICLFMTVNNSILVKGQLKTETGDIYGYQLCVKNTFISTEPMSEIKRLNIFYALIVSGLISFIAIFLFKRQALQLRLVGFNFLFIALAIFYMLYSWYRMDQIKGIEIINQHFQWTVIMIFLIFFLNFGAFRNIRKDIELLASANRMR